MSLYSKISEGLSNILNIDILYIELVLNTLIAIIIIYLLKKLGSFIVSSIKEERHQFIAHQRLRITLNIILIIILLFIWEEYIKDFITLLSFLSAAVAIGLRDVFLNWFCGVYIRLKKIFKIEDRIEIEGVKGDVLMLSTLGFEILEVSDKEENGQSTGVIISFPNSVIFTKPIKNLTKGFHYVWNEMVIKVPMSADLVKTKKEIYKIINSIDEIKNTPGKMQNAIKNINAEYHIYYNQYNPIIYTKVVDKHVELTVRYLINPKKARFVESRVWNQLLIANKNKLVSLYEGL